MRTIRIALLTLLAGLAGANAQRDGEAAPDAMPTLTVRVYNYVEVSDNILRKAADRGERIYRSAGIRTVWVVCNLNTPVSQGPECARSEPLPDEVFVSVMPVQRRRPGISDELGHALGSDGPEKALYAYVFFSLVEKTAAQNHVNVTEVLGCAMAHEVAHLLVGRSLHTERGVGRARWAPADFQSMQVGSFVFAPEQHEVLRARARVRRRNAS